MKYNAKYDRWVSKDGLVYRYDKKNDKLVLANQQYTNKGYLEHIITKNRKCIMVYVHRLVWETFNGVIPGGYQIDHINTIRDDNRLENLRCVTHKENCNNPLTVQKRLGKSTVKGQTWSDFGDKFKKHFGTTLYEDSKLYRREQAWYYRHNKVCRWEVEDKCKS